MPAKKPSPKRRKKRQTTLRKVTGVAAVCLTLLGALSVIPYQLGKSGLIIPSEWKETLTLVGFISAALLRGYNEATS